MNRQILFVALALLASTGLVTAQTNVPAPPGSLSLPTPAQAATSLVDASSAPLPALAAPAEDIRDIRGPVEIPSSLRWVYGGLAGVAAVFAIAWLWKTYRRRRVVMLVRRAYEIAFDELEKARAWMDPEQARQFSIAVSNSLRTYIEGRFRIGATHQTTLEFLQQIAHDKPDDLRRHAGALEDFLHHCDLAKFANWRLSREQMQILFDSAWQFVEQTRPPEPGPGSGRKRRARKNLETVLTDATANRGAA